MIDNFGEKGGLLQRAVDAAAFCSSWVFFQPEKRQKSCSTHEFEANLQMALLSLSYSENEKSTSTFLGNGNIWLIFGVAFLISNKIQNLSSPHLFSFSLFCYT